MGTSKQTDRAEAVRDAATGYAVVVLAIVCFILALAVLVAGVRVVVGLGGSPNAAAPASVPTTTTVAATVEEPEAA